MNRNYYNAKIRKGYLPIYSKNIKRYIGYCDTWGYGNKDTCKYVVESISEDLHYDYKIEVDWLNDVYWGNLISLVHNINGGGMFYNIELVENDS
jgi:hypothetical protein